MKDHLTVSVVIPAYNAAAFISETIATLLPQLRSNDEILVIDDGSEDNTADIVRGLHDPRVKYHWQENSGAPARPRNVGCRIARGDYLCIFDSDDLAAPDKIHASVMALEAHPDKGFLFSNFDMIDEAGNVLCHQYVNRYTSLAQLLTVPVGNNLYCLPGQTLLAALFKANFIGTSSVVMRRSAWEKTEGFDERFLNLDDRDMWLQLCRTEDALYLDLSLHQYRNRGGSISKLRIRHQVCERIDLARKVNTWRLNRLQKKEVNQLLAKSYLKLGYIDFHETDNRAQAIRAFWNSFLHRPSLRALKGVVKSSLPNRLYSLVR